MPTFANYIILITNGTFENMVRTHGHLCVQIVQT